MPPRVTAIHPPCAIEGGRITIEGTGFPLDGPSLPEVRIGEVAARLVYASPTRLSAIVPAGLEGGRARIRVAGAADDDYAPVEIAAPFASGAAMSTVHHLSSEAPATRTGVRPPPSAAGTISDSCVGDA